MSEAADFFGLSVPFLKHLGVKAEMAEGGSSRVSLELRPELLNSFEVSHGGVIMTMLDVAMAVTARSQGPHRRRGQGAARRALFLRRRGL